MGDKPVCYSVFIDTLHKSTRLPLKNTESFTRKTLDNNDLNQVVASSGFSENKGSGQGVLSLAGA